MVVAPVDDGDADRRTRKTMDGFQPTEAGPYHDHMVAGTLDAG